MEGIPARKPNRLEGYDYSSAGYYFVTICTKDRREFLGLVVGAATCRPRVDLTDIGREVDVSINKIHGAYPHISVDKYVIMPNHIHMILCFAYGMEGRQVAAPTTTLQNVIGNMKRNVSMQLGFSIWQKSFHDHVIRNHDDYALIWQYVDENPARWHEDCFYPKQQ